MVLTDEQRIFAIESYFRNGSKVNGNWIYSMQDCFLEFQEKFPAALVEYKSFYDTVTTSIHNFREIGSINRKKGSGRPLRRTEGLVNNVREVVEEQPKISIRRLSQQVNSNYTTCQRVLKKDLNCYPYRLQVCQELLETDFPRRMQFCQWFTDNLAENEEAFSRTFFTDEAYFYLSGYVNSQNMRMWSTENPHFFVEAPRTENWCLGCNKQKKNCWSYFFLKGRLTLGVTEKKF